MRLRTWVRRRGRGAIARLAEATGLSYQSVLAIVHGTQEPKPRTAVLISRATRGAVSVEELLGLRRRRAERAAA